MQVYFDWNIFAHVRDYYIKGDEKKEHYGLILDNIKTGYIDTYYSDAHLYDLIPMENVESSNQFLDNDLKSITLLTNNKYLCYYPMDSFWEFNSEEPKSRYIELADINIFIIDNKAILKDIGIMGTFVENVVDSLSIPECDYEKFVGSTPSSVSALMDLLNNDNKKAMDDPQYFRARKKRFSDDLSTIPRKHEHKKDDLSHKLIQVIDTFMKLKSIAGNLMKDRFGEIFLLFQLMDMYCIGSDKKYRNLIVDSLHALFATHSLTKIFVTEDSNLRLKAKIAYLLLELEINVMSFSEFTKHIKNDESF